MKIKTAHPDFNTAAMLMRRRLLIEGYIEPLRRRLGILEQQVGPLIGLSPDDYSADYVDSPRRCPMDILLLCANKLEEVARERGDNIPFSRPDLWAGEWQNVTNLTPRLLRVLAHLPYPGESPMPCPKRTQKKTIARMLERGLIEEPRPGLYRRTVVGHAAWKVYCWR